MITISESGNPKNSIQIPALKRPSSLKRFLVHFRRPSDYENNNVTKEYGFDWLRDEYIYPIETVNRRTTPLCTDVERLKGEYSRDVTDPIRPYEVDYYPAWLSLKEGKEATLDLELEALEELAEDATALIFESSTPHLQIEPAQINLSEILQTGRQTKNLGQTTRDYYLGNNTITITCTGGTFAEHQQIKVFAQSGAQREEVGKLMIYHNQDIYRLNARFVQVNFKGSIHMPSRKVDGMDIESKLNFSENTVEINVINSPSLNPPVDPIGMETTISNWKRYVEDTEEKAKQKFIQALIEYVPIKKNQRKYDYRKINVDFKKFKIGDNIEEGPGINRIKRSITEIDADGIVCNMREFLLGLREIYEEEYTSEPGVAFFLMPTVIRYPKNPSDIDTRIKHLDGFAEDIFSTGRYVMLARHHKHFREMTLVHEAAHNMGLVHSFQVATEEEGITIVPEHTFVNGTTENIMDYSLNTFSFWKYQWDKLRQDNHDLELIR
ncbi:hypothetical protein AAG747_05555 [Rapidithrix thailandica]|uniref:Uncharacterized protein n=1 Tax=Rapidithrix thailandica TaxID=413964 RepID=A0AAW9S8X8_9BACT